MKRENITVKDREEIDIGDTGFAWTNTVSHVQTAKTQIGLKIRAIWLDPTNSSQLC